MESSMRMSVNIPKVMSKDFLDWKLYYYITEKNLFEDLTNVHESLEKFIKIDSNINYRIQTHIKTVPFLLGVDGSKKELRFLSPRAHRELHLLNEIDESQLGEEQQEQFLELKHHSERVLAFNLFESPCVIDLVTYQYGLENLDDKKYKLLDEKVHIVRKKLTHYVESYKASIFEKLSDYGLTLTANYDLIRIHLLKFVAILSSLDFDQEGTEVKRLLIESLRRLLSDSLKAEVKKLKGTSKALPTGLYILFSFGKLIITILPPKALALLVRNSVKALAKRFIAGETIEEAESSLRELINSGRDATLDQLGELVVSKKEADHYKNEVCKLIRGFSRYVSKGEKNNAGIYKAHVSIKVSALSDDFNPTARDHTYTSVAPRLREILKVAKEHHVFLNIDAEHYHYRDLVFYIYKRVLLETEELKDFQQTGIVLQGYLRDAFVHLQDIIELSKERGHIMPIRLVKGAYWDAETIEADAHSFDAPEFLNKEETDIHFRQLIVEILESYPHVQLCLGGHNLKDHCFAEVLREKHYPNLPEIEHQCLHMTYEALSVGMNQMNWVVRNYVPIGSLLVGMAYLVRRIMENSSQVGVLTQMRSHKTFNTPSPRELLEQKRAKKRIVHDMTVSQTGNIFFNYPPVRLYLNDYKIWWTMALENIQTQLGRYYSNPFLEEKNPERIYSSSDPTLLVGTIQFASREDAKLAIEKSHNAFYESEWNKVPGPIRSSILLEVAHLLATNRLELSALISYEAGKNHEEAMADIDEGIDFITFYARVGLRKMRKYSSFTPRGPVAVISPWNFPLAIPCGMVSASLICGNTVILKSAEQTPLIAQKLVDLFYQAGVPKDVLIHLPGIGEDVGDELVRSEKISSIVFTGSKAVGVHIAKTAANRLYYNKNLDLQYPVKVVTEMGGKNAIIILANAELDETVEGVMYSAFAHAGQKCSACSRVLIDERIKDKFIARFVEAGRDIEVGKAFIDSTFINPLISKEAKENVLNAVEELIKEANEVGGTVHLNRSSEDGLPGHSIGPVIVELPYKQGFNFQSYSQIELFAPIVHVIAYSTKEEALDLFNSTPYALTGGVYSQSQDDMDFFSENLESGNIYFNRPNTGARVGIEPFGGFKLSGTGPKAGTKFYTDSFIIDPYGQDVVKDELSDGSEYIFDLARPSGLRLENRLEKLQLGIDLLFNQFEGIYEGIFAKEKSALGKFKYWCQYELYNFLSTDHDNVMIPGQLSYDSLALSQNHTVIIGHNLRPNIKILFSFLGALANGVGVTILTRGEKSYALWNRVAQCFYNSGISEQNLSIYFVTDELLKKCIQDQNVESFILDGDYEDIQSMRELLFNEDNEQLKYMKKLITQYDSPGVEQYKSFMRQFIRMRSFAINTMRHGAPLEIDLN